MPVKQGALHTGADAFHSPSVHPVGIPLSDGHYHIQEIAKSIS
ncbi:MAG: hypothetical protein QXP70_06015 [Methanomassiliicoccales archaeon]